MDRIGLIAGNGSLPVLFAREAKSRGIQVHAVAHRGETDEALTAEVDSIAWVRVGQLGRMIRALRSAGVSRAVMAGGLDKVRSLASVRPDWRGLQFLRRAARGDDALLRGVADEFGGEGIEIVPSTLFLDRIVPGRGLLAGPTPGVAVREDIKLGCRILAALGPHDVGQSVVVEGGVVLAVEAIEGTDAAIARGGALGRGAGVLIKMAKTGQDMRFDVPAVGPRTLRMMSASGISALALEAGRAIVLDGGTEEGTDKNSDTADFMTLAGSAGITVVGCDHAGEIDDV